MYEFEGRKPRIAAGSFVYPEATIIGDVTIGEGCYIGHGAVIRGDYGTIVIGDRTAIEENCILHARPGEILKIGSDVTIGHGAIIHNCTLEDFCIIGMGAIVSDYATVGVWAVVGEGAVVKNKSVIEPGQIVVGIPTKPVAQVSEDYKKQWTHFKGIYVELASGRLAAGLKKIE
ncbi:MAG: gamma carbonic anhydrase family protein [Candidatus Thermoplasmatota archaeon]|nr:gamma carbonic anhydrase family protein [Euryarchaeota archaeon]MBU4032884.1 gamma carbonic anhydrase family protein [Candidatus Thermoplasmatota archaeon]MBU4070643.1 gamma carbonic anhydrase family protein [Candidatus Thermoplasmatota archaeon]MBU4145138.1 gamma carbonic anhydrase family protein [Candidatus Thermoplasmatota archaeon]MBU4591588.1 gamma carbonic anhydrase family protein [Candidatus Thermoplasmatota archaeon]